MTASTIRHLLLLGWLLSSTLTFSQAITPQPFSLRGTLPPQQTEMVYLAYSNPQGQRQVDSARVTNGVFSFKGQLTGPTHAYLLAPARYDVFLEPTAMTASFPGAQLTGSATHQQFVELNRQKKDIEAKYSRDLGLLTGERDQAKIDVLRERLAPYFQETNQADYHFMAAHPQSAVTLYLLMYQKSLLTTDSLQLYYQGLGTRLQQTPQGQAVAQTLEQMRQGSAGSKAFVFTTQDINEQPLSLANYKGQYVLLDFWASWCVPCRKGNPHLIELYHQYKQKGIEFIGIASDDEQPEAWRKAVAKDQIGIWKQVLLTERGNGERKTKLSDAYGVSAYPTKILIDPQGIIIGRYSSSNEKELDARLQAIFATK